MKDISDSYVCIQGWMITKLNLKGNDLLVYAIIYGFTQDGEQEFKGSLQYLATWTNSTKQGVLKSLKSLIDKGLINKTDYEINGVKFCKYSTLVNGIKQSLPPIKQSLIGGKQSLTNNINNNIENNIEVLSKDNTGPSAEFVFGKDANIGKPKRKTNADELENSKVLIQNYTNNCTLIQQLTVLVNTKYQICANERRHFYATTIKNYLDELTRTFGNDDTQKIEAVKLSIRYNGTTKVMKPNTIKTNNVRDNIERIGPNDYDNYNRNITEMEF